MIPAHKNLKHPPGQIVNRPEYTLNDYISRKSDKPSKEYIPPSDLVEKKLTFAEWWDTYGENTAPFAKNPEQFVWEAAQEHK